MCRSSLPQFAWGSHTLRAQGGGRCIQGRREGMLHSRARKWAKLFSDIIKHSNLLEHWCSNWFFYFLLQNDWISIERPLKMNYSQQTSASQSSHSHFNSTRQMIFAVQESAKCVFCSSKVRAVVVFLMSCVLHWKSAAGQRVVLLFKRFSAKPPHNHCAH